MNIRQFSLQSNRVGVRLGLPLAALTAGVFLALGSLPLVIAVIGALTGVILAIITPLTVLVVVVILAPLRTLIATEAPLQLPLDIGQLTLAGFLAAWLVYRIARRQTLLPRLWSPLYVPIMIFLASITLTIFSAVSLSTWLTEWLKWVQITVLIALVLDLAATRQWQWIIFGVVTAALANALIGIYEFFGGSGADHLIINNRFFRAFGTFGQPNPFGGFMGLIAPIALMTGLGYMLRLWLHWRTTHRLPGVHHWILPAYYGVAGGVMTLALLMSWGRGAWLGYGVAMLAVAFALPRRLWQSLALLAVLALLGATLWFSGQVPAAISDRINSATTEIFAFNEVRGVDITSANYALVERLAHWQAALNMAESHPWLGVGFGNYADAYPDYRLLNWKFPLGHAHNYYLNVFAEAGMIGLVSYLVLWGSVFWLTWRARRHPDVLARCVSVGLLGTWVYLSVHSLTDNLYVNNMFLHLGTLLGVLAVLHRQVYAYTRLES